ncbi:MAG: response regulator [Campylobacterales bacterium]|nr:response regulator [Campylobacterales bacterium]
MSKVIIVEDELIAAEYLKAIVEQSGAEVLEIIDNAKEAIERSIALKPDIIFMDVMLRGPMSGAEAALSISRMVESKIVFLSAHLEGEMVDYAVAAHAAGYLTKPYNEAQIIATLRLLEHAPSTPKTPQAQPEMVELAFGYTYITDPGRLLKEGRQVELGPKALKLVALLCEHAGISVSNEQISMQIWGELVDDRTLRSLIFRTRAQTCEELIKNVSGSGYMIQLP